ncbi:MAG: hypothetical protein GY870_18685 [archaeon]|nr:hypothetical protein [archaeon]
MDGWIKLHRCSFKKGWLKNHNMWIFWTYCLMKANHKKTEIIFNGQDIKLNPGQFIFGIKKACEEINLTPQKVRTVLKNLKKMENITIETTNKYSIISIMNWDRYQNIEKEDNTQTNNQITNKQQTTNNQITTDKNDNNLKNEKNEKKKDMRILENEFDSFWDLYDKKSDRKKCLAKWKRLKDVDKKKIFQTLPTYLDSTPDRQYRKNPATYLNNESWNDIVSPTNSFSKADKQINQIKNVFQDIMED